MKCFQSGGLLRLLHLCSLTNLYLERSCLVRFSTPPSPFLIIPPSVPPFTPLSQQSPLLLKSHLYLLSFHSSSAPHSLLFLLLTLSNSLFVSSSSPAGLWCLFSPPLPPLHHPLPSLTVAPLLHLSLSSPALVYLSVLRLQSASALQSVSPSSSFFL